MPDAYRSSDPEIPCPRHPEVAVSASCMRCGALLCDGCRVFVDGMQTCPSCRPRPRLQPSTFAITCAAVASALLLFMVVTRRPLAQMVSPSPVSSSFTAAAMGLALGPSMPSDIPRCVGETCFYPLRVVLD